MMSRLAAATLLALSVAACNTSSGRQNASLPEAPPAGPPPGSMGLPEAKAAASGYSFLRSAGGDSYEVLYFDGGGRASLLRADQMKIIHGRWVAEVAPVSGSTDPIPAICLTLLGGDSSAPRRCLDPKLLTAGDTEKVKGDVLGIAKWESVPDSLPRERASLSELRERIRT